MPSARYTGLRWLPEPATFEGGGVGVEAYIRVLINRMRAGRFGVGEHLEHCWREFRSYSGKDGKPVRRDDPCLDAIRYAVPRSLRYVATKSES